MTERDNWWMSALADQSGYGPDEGEPNVVLAGGLPPFKPPARIAPPRAAEGGLGRPFDVLPPVEAETPLAGVSQQQAAKLGPMAGQLEKLGATPEQIRTFSPQQAYDFIKARNVAIAGGGVVMGGMLAMPDEALAKPPPNPARDIPAMFMPGRDAASPAPEPQPGKWLMGALAAPDAYRGDYPDWARPSTEPQGPPDQRPVLPDAGGAQLGAIGNTMQRLAPHLVEAFHRSFRAPTELAAKNPYPPGSEEWQHLENVKTDREANFAGDWALNTLGIGRLGGGVKGGLGVGGSKIIQPQPEVLAARPKMGDIADQTKLPLQYERPPTPTRVLTEAERDAPFPNAPFPQYAREYPPSGFPVETLRNPKKPELGTYPAKELSPEGKAFAAARLKIRRDVEQGDYPRYYDPAQRFYVPERPEYAPNVVTATDPSLRPVKQATIDSQLEKLGAPETRQKLQDAYAKGLDLGNAEHWYAMGQLERDYVHQLGPKEGPKAFRDRLTAGMATTTSGQAPTENLLMGHYLNYLEQTGRPMPRASWDTPPAVGGQYTMGGVENYQKMRQGGGYQAIGADQPKMHDFGQNIMGNLNPATLDKQMSVGMTTTPHFKKALTEPQWYGLQEQVLGEEAAKLGLKPGNLQDVAWAGFKGEPGMPLIEHYNQAIERKHRLTGMPRRQIAEGFIRGTIPMYGVAGAIALPALGELFSLEGESNTHPRPDRYPQ